MRSPSPEANLKKSPRAYKFPQLVPFATKKIDQENLGEYFAVVGKNRLPLKDLLVKEIGEVARDFSSLVLEVNELSKKPLDSTPELDDSTFARFGSSLIGLASKIRDTIVSKEPELNEKRAQLNQKFLVFVKARWEEYGSFQSAYNEASPEGHNLKKLTDSKIEELFIGYLDCFIQCLPDDVALSLSLLRKEHLDPKGALSVEYAELLKKVAAPRRFLSDKSLDSEAKLNLFFEKDLSTIIDNTLLCYWRAVFMKTSFKDWPEPFPPIGDPAYDKAMEHTRKFSPERKKALSHFFVERAGEFFSVSMNNLFFKGADSERRWLDYFFRYVKSFILALKLDYRFSCDAEKEKFAAFWKEKKLSEGTANDARIVLREFCSNEKMVDVKSAKEKTPKKTNSAKRASRSASRNASPIPWADNDGVVIGSPKSGAPILDQFVYSLESTPPAIESKCFESRVLSPVQSQVELASTGDALRAERVSVHHPRIEDLARLLLLAMTFEIRGKHEQLDSEALRLQSVRYACVAAMMRQFHSLPTEDQLFEALLRDKNIDRNKLDQEFSGFKTKYLSLMKEAYYKNHFYDADKKVSEEDIAEAKFQSFNKADFIASINNDLENRYRQEQEKEERKRAEETALAMARIQKEKEDRAIENTTLLFDAITEDLTDEMIRYLLFKLTRSEEVGGKTIFVAQDIDGFSFFDKFDKAENKDELLYRVIFAQHELRNYTDQGLALENKLRTLINLLAPSYFDEAKIRQVRDLVDTNIKTQAELSRTVIQGFSKLLNRECELLSAVKGAFEAVGDEATKLAEAIREVLKPSRELVAEHFYRHKIVTQGQLYQGGEDFIRDFKPLFLAEVKKNKILTQYESVGERLWVAVKNVLMCVLFPWLIHRVSSRRSQNLSIFYHSKGAELIEEVQGALFRLAEPPAIR